MIKITSFVTAAAVFFALCSGLPADVKAYSGEGSKSDPIVVTTYEELQGLLYNKNAEGAETLYIRLGEDIASEDELDNYSFCLDSDFTYNVHLDLAGHSISRSAETSDTAIFELKNNAVLTVDDSVGGGTVTGRLNFSDPYKMSCIFDVRDNAVLTINGGSFDNYSNPALYKDVCLNVGGGTVTVNGGRFRSDNKAAEQTFGSLTINNGVFTVREEIIDGMPAPGYTNDYHEQEEEEGGMKKGLFFSSNHGDFFINNCTVRAENNKAWICVNGSKAPNTVKAHIPESATVTADGVQVTLEDETELSAKEITIASPAKPLPGDADGNGKRNIKDVMLIQQAIVGWKVNINISACDVNGDSKVDIRDVMLIQQAIVGWNVTLK